MRLFGKKGRPTIVFIAGEGGHLEQANRILATLEPDLRSSCKCILITDTETVNGSDFDECWNIQTCAPKHRSSRLRDVFTYLKNSASVFRLMLMSHNVKMAIVTGPGFAVAPAIGAKILGAHLVVFESWSRFENRSKCGKALYRLSDQFLVQNKELLSLYPNATWVGLL